MDEKTEELREIFMTVAGEATVTERQEESPGALADDEPVGTRFAAIVARMRDRYEFHTDLSTDILETIARGFYADRADSELASELDLSVETVFHARLDLHLLKDLDRNLPTDFDAFRRAIAQSDRDLSEEFELRDSELERALAVVTAEQQMRQANYRFRDQFDDLLGDGDIAKHLTRELTDDGLADATEGLETNTAF